VAIADRIDRCVSVHESKRCRQRRFVGLALRRRTLEPAGRGETLAILSARPGVGGADQSTSGLDGVSSRSEQIFIDVLASRGEESPALTRYFTMVFVANRPVASGCDSIETSVGPR
jgi:hypothetical protein